MATVGRGGGGGASVDVVTLNRMVACSVVRRVVDIGPHFFKRLAAISIHQLELDPFWMAEAPE